jgi:hypothetical protein
MAARVYRKRRSSELNSWHCCSNCAQWPTSFYDERADVPAGEELCLQCEAKQRNRQCLQGRVITLSDYGSAVNDNDRSSADQNQ